MKKLMLGSLSLLLMFAVWGCNKNESVNSGGKKTISMWVHVSDDNEEGKVYKKGWMPLIKSTLLKMSRQKLNSSPKRKRWRL